MLQTELFQAAVPNDHKQRIQSSLMHLIRFIAEVGIFSSLFPTNLFISVPNRINNQTSEGDKLLKIEHKNSRIAERL